ncbi:Helix-turn-helix domain protein [compost metagenome]
MPSHSTTAHNADLWTPAQAAHELGVSIRTLSAWRSTGRYTLPYVKVGRLVRYRQEDVREWLQRHLQSTAKGQQ